MGLPERAPVERRGTERRQMLKGATIVVSADRAALPCVVRDLSDDGARLQVACGESVPDTFEMIVELDGLSCACEVVWRQETRVGVRFSEAPKAVEPSHIEYALQNGQGGDGRLSDVAASTRPCPGLVGADVPQSDCTELPNALLIAEDDPDDRYLIADAFEQSAFEHPVEFVVDGTELLKYLRAEQPFADRARPGLLLLDLNMPKMDGRTALTHIKADPELSQIPIIVFTTSNAEADIERTYELGVSGFVSKPNSMSEMIELVQSLDEHWMRWTPRPVASVAAAN